MGGITKEHIRFLQVINISVILIVVMFYQCTHVKCIELYSLNLVSLSYLNYTSIKQLRQNKPNPSKFYRLQVQTTPLRSSPHTLVMLHRLKNKNRATAQISPLPGRPAPPRKGSQAPSSDSSLIFPFPGNWASRSLPVSLLNLGPPRKQEPPQTHPGIPSEFLSTMFPRLH